MNHILIVAGGNLDVEFAKAYCKTLSFDKVFAVDKGLEYMEPLCMKPDYIIGDFDTVDKVLLSEWEKQIELGKLETKLIRHNVMKDESDTELAVRQAIADKPQRITILGGTGTRLDHALMNMEILLQIEKKGIAGELVDKHNRIRLLDSEIKNDPTGERNFYGVYMSVIKNDSWNGEQKKYLSLIPLSEKVSGLTLQGVLYPLSEYTIFQGSTLTLSNEITDDEAHISMRQGRVLVIEAID